MRGLAAKLINAFGIGRVTLADDSGPVRRLQVSQGPSALDGSEKIIDKVPHVQHFGHAATPPLGTEVMMLRLNGERSLSIIVGTNHQPSRPRDLPPGDSALYDVRGAIIHLTPGGIVIDGAGLPITVQNFGTATYHGDVHATGDVVSRSAGTAVSLNALRDAYDAHKHDGVQTGGGSTGTTDQPV